MTAMDTQNIVVTLHTSPEPKALFREVPGSAASLTFLDEIAPSQRNETPERAQIVLAWNFPREISP